TIGKPKSIKEIVVPVIDTRDSVVAHSPRRVFSNAHAYHINSISINSDGETYISSDDLRINLWNLNISDQSFSKSFSFPPLPPPPPRPTRLALSSSFDQIVWTGNHQTWKN